MFFDKFPEGLFCLGLRNCIDESRVPRSHGDILWQGVPVLVGQRCLNDRVGKIYNSADSSYEGNMFDTCGDSLTNYVQGSLSGDLVTICVSSGSESRLEEG